MRHHGEVAEWLKAAVSKTAVGLCSTGGSNPSLSAILNRRPTSFGHQQITVQEAITEWLAYCENVQNCSPETLRRSRAAIEHFRRFARSCGH